MQELKILGSNRNKGRRRNKIIHGFIKNNTEVRNDTTNQNNKPR